MDRDSKGLFINRVLTIKDAMKQMDKASKKILFVTDKRRKLIGTITDGDIRRWILSDGDLKQKVSKIYNKKPVYAKSGISKRNARKMILEQSVESLPIIDENGKIIDIFFWKDVVRAESDIGKSRTDLKVPIVIMAGGQGSRLDPFTRILPKALIPIGDKPVIEVIIDNFLQYIRGDIQIIMGYKGEMVESYFDNTDIKYKINYIYEGKKPLGTAGGLKNLSDSFPETFFLSNCDTIIKARHDDIYAFHKERGYDITIIGSMQHFVVPYGVMKINSGGELNKLEEKPEYDFLVNTGMYVIEKKVLKLIPTNKMFHVTDLIRCVKAENGKIGVYPISEKSWLDVGQWETYKSTTKNLLGES